ncbi:uncharacterized protein LOC124133013 [Haliotis rufescens]|uniref:uncharacterized protein LOC124133013 n=1 Tax=Haliotis rufescens TaxID=6454 RepID=UPI00201EA51D|nr:uncharacterized protein LOC124133013 [Haliotis rufescens]XP_046353155.2 uncharacterized protein LOC124133013 [Haliotis rufescens]
MKTITALVVTMVMILSSATSVTGGFFTVDCVSKDLAFLCTDTAQYDVIFPRGCGRAGGKGNFTLTTPCLNDTQVFVVSRKVNDTYRLTGGRGTRVFTVTCEEVLTQDGAPATVTTVVNVHADASHDHLHVHVPVTVLTMLVTTKNPAESSADLHRVTEEVNLGQALFLVIRSKKLQSHGQFFLPRQCTAKSGPPLNLTLTLWSNTSTHSRCIDQPSLVDQFTVYRHGRLGYNLAYVPVYAFYFQQMFVHGNEVTYSCSVTVCPESAVAGYCSQELQRLSSNNTQCIKQIPGTARKRRDVGQASTSHTTTLTVTIRIRNFNLGQAKEGSSSSGVVIIAATGGVVVSVTIVVVVCAVMLIVVTRRRNKDKGRLKRSKDGMELRKF